ncbi:MAG TPA: hypothetical protein VIL72_12355, partial [Beijerinckiaceae bacterium]
MHARPATALPPPADARRAAARLGRAAALAGLLLAALAGAARAQVAQVDCRALQAQIAAMPSSRGDPRAAAAADRQRVELDRTLRASASLGCDRRQFLFFGEPPPPQCGALQQRIAAMQSNL